MAEEITPSEENISENSEETTLNEEDSISPKEIPSQEESQKDSEESKEIQKEIDPEIVEDQENPVQKKQIKIQKILIITAGVLGGILVLGIILYFFGVFDSEKPSKPLIDKSIELNQTKEPEKYIFNEKDINSDRLNTKLRLLTKYEIIGTQEEERQKELEKNSKLSTAQINDLLKSEEKQQKKLKQQQEENIKELEKKKKEEEIKKAEERKKEEELKKKQEEKRETKRPYDLLKFIQVYLDKQSLTPINTEIDKFKVKISKCSENNQNFLLIGPFNSNKELNQVYRLIYKDITQNTTKKDLARLEFNKICR